MSESSADDLVQRASTLCGRTSSMAAISRGRRMSGSFRQATGRRSSSGRARGRAGTILCHMLLARSPRGDELSQLANDRRLCAVGVHCCGSVSMGCRGDSATTTFALQSMTPRILDEGLPSLFDLPGSITTRAHISAPQAAA